MFNNLGGKVGRVDWPSDISDDIFVDVEETLGNGVDTFWNILDHVLGESFDRIRDSRVVMELKNGCNSSSDIVDRVGLFSFFLS